jgi:hypothetical protein
VAFGPVQLNAPPPNPVVDPAAARESSKLGMLAGGAPPASALMGPPGASPPDGSMPPGGPAGMPAGPDLGGLMMLGQKVDEAILTLASVMPAVAPQLDQARELVANAVASHLQNLGSAPGIPGIPGGNAGLPRGGGIVQAGTQFPGGGFGAGRVA